MSGIRHFDVIDMDTIQKSDLHTHMFFREADIGKSKSRAAANYITARFPDVHVNVHECLIQSMHTSFFENFTVVMCSANNPGTLQWVNRELGFFVERDEHKTILKRTVIPLIIGRTDCFEGECKVIIPRTSGCYNCFISSKYSNVHTYYLHRNEPEDCVNKVARVLWNEVHQEKFDMWNQDHVAWVNKTVKHSYHVMPDKVYPVIKTINVGVICTSAVVASVCTNEALKIATQLVKPTYFIEYDGANSTTINQRAEVRSGCRDCQEVDICGHMIVNPNMTVGEWRNSLDFTKYTELLAIRYPGKSVYVPNSKHLAAKTRSNLSKKMIDVIPDNTRVRITCYNWFVSKMDVFVTYERFGFLEVCLRRDSYYDALILCSTHSWV